MPAYYANLSQIRERVKRIATGLPATGLLDLDENIRVAQDEAETRHAFHYMKQTEAFRTQTGEHKLSIYQYNIFQRHNLAGVGYTSNHTKAAYRDPAGQNGDPPADPDNTLFLGTVGVPVLLNMDGSTKDLEWVYSDLEGVRVAGGERFGSSQDALEKSLLGPPKAVQERADSFWIWPASDGAPTTLTPNVTHWQFVNAYVILISTITRERRLFADTDYNRHTAYPAFVQYLVYEAAALAFEQNDDMRSSEFHEKAAAKLMSAVKSDKKSATRGIEEVFANRDANARGQQRRRRY